MLNSYLYDLNPVLSDLFITSVYVFILGFLSFYAMTDYFKARKGVQGGAERRPCGTDSAYGQTAAIG